MTGMSWIGSGVVVLGAASLLPACGEATDETPVAEAAAILGDWADDWDTEHSVTATRWTMTSAAGSSVFLISELDDDGTFLIAHNDAANAYNPGAWSRFDWTTHNDAVYFCQTAYAATSEQEARQNVAADPTDPTSGGCGGFAWSRLRAPLALRGTYTDNYGTTHVIQQALWTQTFATDLSAFNITAFDNAARFLVAQNDAANAYFPAQWSRFDWTRDDTALWYCQTVFDADTEAQARAAAAADATDPSSGGCGGFPWSRLDPP